MLIVPELRSPVTRVCFGLLLLLTSAGAAADDWRNWRGPTADGAAAAEAMPPTVWSESENVAWVADLPGEGSSTPVVVNGYLYVLSAEDTGVTAEEPPVADPRSKTRPPDTVYRFLVSCLRVDDGELIWKTTVCEAVPHEGIHPSHSYCGGSPVSDGRRLYASFGSRGTYCLDLKGGAVLWERQHAPLRTRYGWGEAVTPAIYDGRLVLNLDQEENSRVLCLDAETGEPLWEAERPGEVTSWNTPLICPTEGGALVVLNGTDRVRAYALEDGQQRWTCAGQTVNAIPSPVRFEDSVICMSGYRGAIAVRLPLSGQGELDAAVDGSWVVRRGTPYVPSPLLSGSRLFFTQGNGDILTCLDAETGERLLPQRRLSGLQSVYASPIAAGGHLYFVGRNGTTVVLRDDEPLTPVSVNALGVPIDASPVAVDRSLILRARSRLICIRSDQNRAD